MRIEFQPKFQSKNFYPGRSSFLFDWETFHWIARCLGRQRDPTIKQDRYYLVTQRQTKTQGEDIVLNLFIEKTTCQQIDMQVCDTGKTV